MGIEIYLGSNCGVRDTQKPLSKNPSGNSVLYLKDGTEPPRSARKTGTDRPSRAVELPSNLRSSLIHCLTGKRANHPAEPPPSYEEAMLDKAAEEALHDVRAVAAARHAAFAEPSQEAFSLDEATSTSDATGTSVVHDDIEARPAFLDKELQQLSGTDALRLLNLDGPPPVPDDWDIQHRPAEKDLIYLITEKDKDGKSRNYSKAASYENRQESGGLQGAAATPHFLRRFFGKLGKHVQPDIGRVFAHLARDAAQTVRYPVEGQNKQAVAGNINFNEARKSKKIARKKLGLPPPNYIPGPPPPNYIPAPPASGRKD